MATDLQTAPATTVPKHDAYVEKQLGRARGRIRALDLAGAGLGFVILTLAYALLMVVLDKSIQLPLEARQVAFWGYVAGAIGYLTWTVGRPLLRQVNPYYAARQLERTLPDAKNSLVNWLDLRGQPLPAAVQTALGQRAARDLTQTNLDDAVSPTRVSWLGGIAGGLLLGLVLLFLLGPGQFLSLLGRAFAPFQDTAVPTRTQLVLLQPDGGDVTIPIGRAVAFSVEVGGRVPTPGQPDALRLLYRYQPGDGYEEKPLERGDSAHHWVAALPASQVRNGFWYKIMGGDAETPEYRVQVRTVPLLTGFTVTYHYRPYLGWPEQTTPNANLEGHRGTEVTLVARTNRKVKEGQLILENGKPLFAELLPEDPHALRFKLVLDTNGKYRIFFTSTENERNSDPMPYTIKVLNDLAPTVELKKPGSDIELPPGGTLRLEGNAGDDFGVARLTLHLNRADGLALKARPYREGKSFRLADGTFPQRLEYKDFVELEKLTSATGLPVRLEPGQVLEYWLEAADGCDFPGPNLARTPTFRVTITKPAEDPEQQKNERQVAQKEQQQHEQQQDQELNQENQKRQNGQRNQPRQEQPGKGEERNQQNQTEANAEQRQQDKELQEKLDRLQREAEKRQQDQANQPGQAKEQPPQPEKGEPKGQGDTPPRQQPDQGQGKPQGQQGGQEQQGQPKNEGQPDQQQPRKGEGKGQGEQQSRPMSGGEQGQPQEHGSAKSDPQQTPQGQPKNGGQPQAAGGEPKAQPRSGTEPGTAASQPKPGQNEPRGGGTAQGEPKGAGQPQPATAQQPQSGEQDPKAAAKALARDLLGDDPKKREEAARQIAEAQRQAERGSQSNDPKQQADAARKMRDAAEAARELAREMAGKDEKTRQAAADALKRAMDNAQREEQAARGAEKQQITDAARKLEGGNPQERKLAQEQLEKMAQNAAGRENRQAAQEALDKQRQGASAGDPQTKQEVDKLAKQMQSGDPKARAEARQKLEQMAKEAVDPKTREMANQALARKEPAGAGDPKAKEQIDKLAKQLQSGNAQERDQARQQLEKVAREANDAQTRQAAAEALKKNEASAQGQGQGDPKQKQEIDKLAKQMQSPDARERDAARAQLEKMAKGAGDEATRKQAQDALARGGAQGQQGEQNAGQLKDALEDLAKQLQTMDAQQREALMKQLQQVAKNAQGEQQRLDAAEARRQAQELAQAMEKLSPEAKQTLTELAKQMQSQNAKERQEAEQKLGEMSKNNQDEATRQAAEAMQKQLASGRKTNTDPTGDKTPRDDPPAPGAAADKRFGEQAGSMSLQSFQEFKKKLTKEMMNEARITEADLRALEAMIRRREEERRDTEKLVGPQRGGGLAGQGVRQVQPGTPGSTGAQRTGPALPPPELRDGQSEFTRRLSERQQKPGAGAPPPR